MSKYIDLEDTIHNINLEVTGRKEYTGDMKANLFFALDDLPTIEVSDKADRPFEYFEGYEDGKASVEVSEEELRKKYKDFYEQGKFDALVEVSEDFVKDTDVPISEDCISRAEGEWLACTKEGLILYELARSLAEKWYGYKCSECGYIHKGNALRDFKFCPNCGAKMKGAECQSEK